jgi:N-acetylglutamate synthase-like GNAT family acetyltransferase
MAVNQATLEIGQPEFGSSDWAEAVALRRAVLRTPLGLDYSAADLAAEHSDTLFAARESGQLVGVVMLRPVDARSGKLRQMAVAETMRRRGVGERLVATLEAYARASGITEIELASRVVARGFYERLGYVAEGTVFIEVSVPHIHMRKRI